MCDSLNNDAMCMDCRSELNLHKLCVHCLKAKGLLAQKFVTDDLCSLNAKVSNLSVNSETANNLCVSGTLSGSQVSAANLNANNFCLMSGSINQLCVRDLQVSNLSSAVKYRAAVTNNVDSTYTLGSPINWNVVIDDPNSNVALAPFRYIVPVSGYYLLTLHMNIDTLKGADVISGIPVGLMTLLVNGNELRTDAAPFLSFNPQQKTTLSTLSLLNAGDALTMKYDVIVVDPVNGLMPYVGTINLQANGSFPAESGFGVHYLSSLNQSGPITCTPCQPISIPCSPVDTTCDKSGVCRFDSDMDSMRSSAASQSNLPHRR